MSFSGKVKEEIYNQVSAARHCQIAELAAIIMLCGKIGQRRNGDTYIKIQTENILVARKYFTLLKKTFNMNTDVLVKQNVAHKKTCIYILVVKRDEYARKIIAALKLIDEDGSIRELTQAISTLLTGRSCCKRAFIRGAFLAAGSISDPSKFYHFEVVCDSDSQAVQLRDIMNSFDMDAKIVLRKRYHVVYVKEGAKIVDMLNIMEAHVSLMNMENLRIVKEMRNSVNRRVNCETANINKTVSAAVKQLEDIRFIAETVGFSELSDGLQQMAELRLENPDATLKELGEMLTPMVGKSGVNHRLRKISEFADKLRG